MKRVTKDDLVCLVADKNMQHMLQALLARHRALGIRAPRHTVVSHPEHDPGCLRHAHELLRLFLDQAERALVLFDREGCGRENTSREVLEAEVETLLADNGWKDRSAAIVLDPELEIWLWSDSPRVDEVLGWQGRSSDLRSWLREKGLLDAGNVGSIKPSRPKEAVEAVLRVTGPATGTRRSSALYSELASKLSVTRCSDPAFSKLRATLRTWFPIEDGR